LFILTVLPLRFFALVRAHDESDVDGEERRAADNGKCAAWTPNSNSVSDQLLAKRESNSLYKRGVQTLSAQV
jgi:hypothetical protein